MSNVIENNIVQMGFDNKDFEKNVATSLGTIDKLKRSLDFTGAVKGIDALGKSISANSFNTLANSVENISSKFSAMGVVATATLVNITNRALSAAENLGKMFTVDPITTGLQEYETYIDSTQTILANTKSAFTEAGKSEAEQLEAVNEKLNELNHYADKTIYNFTQMTQNIGRFTAAGVDLDTSVTAIKGIANLAAVSGSTSQQASTAMYQLSQALASGTVKLQDWNSVVNANMGGKVFQDALIETARVMNTGVDAAIEKAGNFRESLKEEWLTTEVLTKTLEHFTYDLEEMTEAELEETKAKLRSEGYTEDQIKNILELGKTASDAATKVKTFTQLMDTLKEAAQSGWTTTWQYIIGDFNQAKELWSELGDYFGGIIDKSSKARNEIFEAWSKGGGRDTAIRGIKNIWNYLLDIVRPIKEAWKSVFPDWPKTWLLDLTKRFKMFTNGLFMTERLFNDMSATFTGLFEIVKIGVNILKAFGTGVSTVAKNSGSLLEFVFSMTSGIKDLADRLSASADEFGLYEKITTNVTAALSVLRDTFSNVAEAIKMSFYEENNIFASFVSGFLMGISYLIQGFLELILTFTDSGETAVTLVKWIENVDVGFRKLANTITDFIYNVGEKGLSNILLGWVDSFKEWVKSIPFIDIIVGKLSSMFGAIKSIATIDTSGIDGFFNKLKERFKPLEGVGQFFVNLFRSIGNLVSPLIKNLIKLFSDFGNSLIEAASNLNFEKVADIIQSLIGGQILVNLSHFATAFGDITSFVGDLEDDAKVLTNTLTSSLKVFMGHLQDDIGDYVDVERLKAVADIFKAIAVALIALAGSIFILSSIDSDKMSNSVGVIVLLLSSISTAVGLLVGALSNTAKASTAANNSAKNIKDIIGGFMTSLTGASDKIWTIRSVSGLIKSLVAAIGVLTLSLIAISFIDTTKAWSSIAVLIAMLGSMVLVIKYLADLKVDIKKMTTLGTILLELSIAIGIISSAVAKLSKTDDIGYGLLSLIVILGSLYLFVTEMNKLEEAGDLKKVAAGILVMSIGIGILASSVKMLAKVNSGDLAQGLLSLAAILGGIFVFVLALDRTDIGAGDFAKFGASLIVFGAGITLLAAALKILSTITLGEMLVSLLGVAGALGLFIAYSRDLEGLGGTALVIAAIGAAMVVLSLGFKALGSIGFMDFVISMGVLIGTLFLFGIAGTALEPVVPVLLGIAGAIALLGLGTVLAGAGLTAIAIGLSALVGVVLQAGTTITAIIMELFLLIPAFFKSIGEGIITFVQTIAGSISAILEALAQIWTAILDFIIAMAPQTIETLFQLLDMVLDALILYLPTLVSKLTVAVLTTLKSLFDAILDTICEFWGIHSPSTKMADIGKFLMEGLIKGLLGKLSNALQTVKDLGAKLVRGMKDKLSEWKETGKNMALGVATGIKNNIDKVVSEARSLGSRALSTLKQFLQIKSPSRAFAELGMYSSLGFAKGMSDNVNSVVNASKEVGQTAQDSLSDALMGAYDGVIFDDLNPVITPVLDLTNLQNGANNLQSLFDGNRSLAFAADANVSFNRNQEALVNARLRSKDNENRNAQLLNQLYTDFQKLGDRLTSLQVVMDSGVLVGSISSQMDSSLGTRSVRASRERV